MIDDKVEAMAQPSDLESLSRFLVTRWYPVGILAATKRFQRFQVLSWD